jgi:2'-5' RNA ligase
MSMTYSQKWCLVALLEDVSIGYEFDMKDYPLHITLVDVHDFDWGDNKLKEKFQELIKQQQPFGVSALGFGALGPADKPTKVTFIEKSPRLIELHEKIIKFLEASGAVFNNQEWNHEGFLPHSTIQKTGKVEEHSEITINNIALIDMFHESDWKKRKIAWKINQA